MVSKPNFCMTVPIQLQVKSTLILSYYFQLFTNKVLLSIFTSSKRRCFSSQNVWKSPSKCRLGREKSDLFISLLRIYCFLFLCCKQGYQRYKEHSTGGSFYALHSSGTLMDSWQRWWHWLIDLQYSPTWIRHSYFFLSYYWNFPGLKCSGTKVVKLGITQTHPSHGSIFQPTTGRYFRRGQDRCQNN